MRILCNFLFTPVLLVASALSSPGNPTQELDALVEKGLTAEGLQRNAPISDQTFVRRIYLDIVGRIPTKSESEAFLTSDKPNKRDRLIDQLLNSDGYVSHHYHFWADLLRARSAINGNGQSLGTGRAYEQWIKTSLRNNKPYDQMVRELITATGQSWENGAVGYYIRDYGMPLDNTAMTAQVFLGTELVCAQCHNHPFDKWTQMDYYHLASFTFGMLTSNKLPEGESAVRSAIEQMPRKLSSEKQKELNRAFSEILKPVRFNNVVATQRRPRLPHDYQYDDAKPRNLVSPKSIMGPEAVLSKAQHPAESFADWLTSPDNPRFALVMSNRLWKKAFGVGIIEPVDQMKDHSMASNPELIAYLENLFKDLNFDMKAYLGAIYKSVSYQREASLEEVPRGTPYYFQGPVLRRMSAEQVWDSMIAMVRENPDKPDPLWELKGKETILRRKIIGESVYNQSPKQYLRNGLKVLRIQKNLSVKIDAAVDKLTRARESDDLDAIVEASKEVKSARQELISQIERQVYLSGLQQEIETASLSQTGEGETPADPFYTELLALIEKQEKDDIGEALEAIIDDETGIIATLARALLADERAAIEEDAIKLQRREMKQWKVEENRRSRYRNFEKLRKRMVRASELPSPAPPGHFLREFGQSDRELIDNSSDLASVTQALAMLNGSVSTVLANQYSVFTREMKEGNNFRERLNNIYQSLFSRPATPKEFAIFREAWDSDPEAAAIPSIAWTLLNTRQFLFY